MMLVGSSRGGLIRDMIPVRGTFRGNFQNDEGRPFAQVKMNLTHKLEMNLQQMNNDKSTKAKAKGS